MKTLTHVFPCLSVGSFNDVEVSKVSPGANTEKKRGRNTFSDSELVSRRVWLRETTNKWPQKTPLLYLLRRMAILRGFLMGLPFGVNMRAGSLKAWEVAINTDNSAAQFNNSPTPKSATPRLSKIDL